MLRTLSGLFLVGALNRPRKREKDKSGKSPDRPRANRENPRKIGKVPKRTKKDKKGRTSPDRETLPFENPPFSGPGSFQSLESHKVLNFWNLNNLSKMVCSELWRYPAYLELTF